MINISGKQLCQNCFAEITSEPCGCCGFSSEKYEPDPTVLPCGSVLQGRYAVGKVIGKGGFGITYLAYDTKYDNKVAVKEYYPYGIAMRNPESTIISVSTDESADVFKKGAEKFYDEARLVAAFNGNPNIVSVYDFFYENDTVYYTMEYLEGNTLKDYVAKNGVITAEQAVFLADRVSSALMTAHSSNILHRDISPDNIMLCSNGKIKLLDFGAARQVIANASQSLSVILKPGFAPLEQYQKKGRQGPWTDIYSLGATLYYALTTDIPDDPMTRLEDDSEYASNKYSINSELWEIIYKSTMLKIEERYNNIFEFRTDLSNLSIKPEPIIPYNTPEKIVLPSGVTAKPYSRSVKKTEAKAEKEISYTQTAYDTSYTVKAEAVSNTLNIPVSGSEVQNPQPARKKRKPNIFVIIAEVAAAVFAAVIVLPIIIGMIASKDKDIEQTNADTVTVTASANDNKTNQNGGGNNQIGNGGNTTTTAKTTAETKAETIVIGGRNIDVNKNGTLNLSNKKLTNDDIAELGKLKKLKRLIISGNPDITDLSCISGLTQIEELTFHNCNVNDLSFAAKLKSLKNIGAENNGITDISPLAKLTNLEQVWLQRNNVSDISALAKCSKLEAVSFSYNKVTDISVLEGKKELKYIHFLDCGLTSIAPLKDCTKIEEIYISDNKLATLTPLGNSKQLKYLYAANNALNGNYDAITGLTVFEVLDISGNGYEADAAKLNDFLYSNLATDENGVIWYY